jgi:Lipase (class 3)
MRSKHPLQLTPYHRVHRHSLGGAVATLCTLRLLRQLPLRDDYPLRCIAFATPSIGNAALSALVAERHWDAYLSNFLLPEDVIVQLTSPSQVEFLSYISNISPSAFRPPGPGVASNSSATRMVRSCS